MRADRVFEVVYLRTNGFKESIKVGAVNFAEAAKRVRGVCVKHADEDGCTFKRVVSVTDVGLLR